MTGEHAKVPVTTALPETLRVVDGELIRAGGTQPVRDRSSGNAMALAASVWMPDVSHAIEVARRLRCGVVWINDDKVCASEMPHPRQAQHAYGADLPVEAAVAFTAIKYVAVRLPRANQPEPLHIEAMQA